MSAQNRYGFSTPIGCAGGLVDIAPYAIDTFLNEEDTGKLQYGLGVVIGSKPGSNIALPVASSVAGDFCGITVNNRTTEYDVEGKLTLRKAASVGVMQWGRIYARVAANVVPEYGDNIYLIVDGDEAGYFTNAAASTEDQSTDPATVKVPGRFLGTVDANAQIAIVEIYNVRA